MDGAEWGNISLPGMTVAEADILVDAALAMGVGVRRREAGVLEDAWRSFVRGQAKDKPEDGRKDEKVRIRSSDGNSYWTGTLGEIAKWAREECQSRIQEERRMAALAWLGARPEA